MSLYQVNPGCHFGASNEFAPGDIVEIEDTAAQGFLDKLTPVQEPERCEAMPSWNGLDDKIARRLESAGFNPATVCAASDDELLAVRGIGETALEQIREALNGTV